MTGKPGFSVGSDALRLMRRGIGWDAGQLITTQMIRVVLFVILSRSVSIEALGTLALASATVGWLQILANQGLSTLLVQAEELAPGLLDTAFWSTAGGGLALMLLLMAGAGPIAALLHQPGLQSVMIAAAPAILAATIGTVPFALLQRRLDFRRSGRAMLIGQISAGLVAAALLLAGAGIWAVVVRQIIEPIIAAIGAFAASGWRPHADFRWRQWTASIRTGRYLILTRFLWGLRERCDQFIIAALLGPHALGGYVLVRRLFDFVVNIPIQLVEPTAFRLLSRLQSKPGEFRDTLLLGLGISTGLSFPLLAATAVLPDEWLVLALGQNWADLRELIAPVALRAGAVVLTGYYLQSAVAAGRIRWRAAFELGRLLVLTAAMILAATLWSLETTAWINGALMAAGALVALVPLWRHAAISVSALLRPPGLAALVSGLAILAASNLAVGPRLRLPIELLFFGLASLVCIGLTTLRYRRRTAVVS
jgi:O-antigen/teichoic acid export membrane protein